MVFCTARDMLDEIQQKNLCVRILEARIGNKKQYNRPTCNEVATLMVGNGSEEVYGRDIIVSTIQGHLKRINETHPSYISLQYPLLFPFGEDGWKMRIRFTNTNSNRNNSRKEVSMRDYYAFQIHNRLIKGKTFLQGCCLFQPFLVDAYVAVEEDRLQYIRTNQKKLRYELYQGLKDTVIVGDTNATAIGRQFILPSSCTRGLRYMIQNYQDAMVICK